MTDLPVLPPATVDAAVTGSWCPKLCTFACPVTAATGCDDAVPWSFHRAVTDLAEGRRPATEVADDLVACTGCLACREPCDFDQDVPAQVRDARAVAPPRTAAAEDALGHLAAGRRPDGSGTVVDDPRPVTPGTTVLVAGCHDPAEVVHAARRLLEAAGREVAVIDDGCCGQLARDLGATELAAARADHRARQLDGAGTVVTLDPHCAPAMPDDRAVTDLWSLLADADLPWVASEGEAVAWHDPCLLARRDGVTTPPRALLAAAGIAVHEPEFTGSATACSGAGMGLPLLDADAADATAARRSTHLAATGAPAVATACSRAADRLRHTGTPTHDLAVLLASRLPERP